jgi:hypothetical protein
MTKAENRLFQKRVCRYRRARVRYDQGNSGTGRENKNLRVW